MRKPRLTKLMTALAAVAMVLWLSLPAQAESGCHKVKGKGTDVKNVDINVEVIA